LHALERFDHWSNTAALDRDVAKDLIVRQFQMSTEVIGFSHQARFSRPRDQLIARSSKKRQPVTRTFLKDVIYARELDLPDGVNDG